MMRFFEAMNKPGVVIILLLLMLSILGFLYYRNEAGIDTSSTMAPEATAPGATVPETTVNEAREGGATAPGGPTTPALEAGETVFVHRATPESIADNSTYIDHPLANNNPDAFILVTQILDSESDATDDGHPIGVWYDANRASGRWAIFNQDLAAMPEGTAFNVTILEGPGNVVHRVAPANTVANSTYLDHPLANDDPDALLMVTANWNPGGGAGTYNDHVVGVEYDANREKWAISNLDLAPMPLRIAFNVAVSESPER